MTFYINIFKLLIVQMALISILLNISLFDFFHISNLSAIDSYCHHFLCATHVDLSDCKSFKKLIKSGIEFHK